jgi:hypothetical protein
MDAHKVAVIMASLLSKVNQQTASPQTLGACYYDLDGQRKCFVGTQDQCDAIPGEFFPGQGCPASGSAP